MAGKSEGMPERREVGRSQHIESIKKKDTLTPAALLPQDPSCCLQERSQYQNSLVSGSRSARS